MAYVLIDGAAIRTTTDFFDQFYAQMEGLIPDYGSNPALHNIDGLVDYMRDLTEPLTVRWITSEAPRARQTELDSW